MKIRYGFVTNSSSSSFIIAAKKGIEIRFLENDLPSANIANELCKQVFNGNYRWQNNEDDEFNKFSSLSEMHNFEKEESYEVWWIRNNRDKIEKLFEQGYEIYQIAYSHYNNVLNAFFKEVVKLPDIICINCEDF